MTTKSTKTITIEATTTQTASIIFLHGLGDTGSGWSSTISRLKPTYAKLICPTAQIMPVSTNFGFPMTAWFDFQGLAVDGPQVDDDGIKKAQTFVHQMIAAEEKTGIASNRIFLGGFSQGGALALYSGLTYANPIAGILAMSTWLPKSDVVLKQIESKKEVPVLQCHGDVDLIVNLRWGQTTSKLLSKALTNYEFKLYKGLAHTSSKQELNDAKAFITRCLPNQTN